MVDKQIDYIKKLIEEVKKEMSQKKVILENKTPKDVSDQHRQNIKEYVRERVFDAIKNAEA